MAKRPTKSKKEQKEISAREKKAAEEAASAVVAEFEEETDEPTFEDTGTTLHFGSEEAGEEGVTEEDVFQEGFERAKAIGQSVRFHIKRNSEFLTVKDWPYSWERLQKEYGPGYYQIMAKSRGTGKILKSQTEMVGDPNAGKEESAPLAPSAGTDQLALMSMMDQLQERAMVRAQSESKSGTSDLATVMTAMMQSQAENSRMMMTMMQESNKQFQTLIVGLQDKKPAGPDPMLTLVTTLLTKKPDGDGFTMQGVMKMIQDAESRAETRANRVNEQIKKEAESRAELIAAGMGGEDGESESGTMGLVKGFLPVLTQLMAQNQQPTPEQVMAARMEEQRRLNGGALPPGTDFQEPSQRPAITSTTPRPRPQQPQRQQTRTQPPAGATTRNEPLVATAPTKNVEIVPTPPAEVQNVKPITQEAAADPRLKAAILDFCLPDIGNALLNRQLASTTAETVLAKLEKEGYQRQTIAKLFTLDDFNALAKQYELPAEALPWIKEFHETIQQKGQIVVGTSGAAGKSPNGAANGARKPGVAASGSAQARPSASPQPRPSRENI